MVWCVKVNAEFNIISLYYYRGRQLGYQAREGGELTVYWKGGLQVEEQH
jgi:hypothetical protein